MSPDFTKLLSELSPALIAFIGVIVGGLITAAIERQKMNREADRHIRREAVAVMQGARLLSNELIAIMAALKTANDDPNYHLDATDLGCPSWGKYEAALTTYLPPPDLERALHALYVMAHARRVDVNGSATKPADRQALLREVFQPLAEAREALRSYMDLPSAVEAVRRIQVPPSLVRRISRRAFSVVKGSGRRDQEREPGASNAP